MQIPNVRNENVFINVFGHLPHSTCAVNSHLQLPLEGHRFVVRKQLIVKIRQWHKFQHHFQRGFRNTI